MKKTFTFCMGLILSFGCFAQLQNGDFETWDSLSINQPIGWYNSNSDAISKGFGPVVTQSSPYSGTYAVKLETKVSSNSVFGFISNSDKPDQAKGGTPFTQQPDSFVCQAKLGVQTGDTALFLVIFKVGGSPMGMNLFKVSDNANPTTWQRLAFKLPAFSTAPDSVVIAAVSSNIFGSGMQDGSFIILDDLAFVSGSTSTPFPNGDFENWSMLNIQTPAGWDCNSAIKFSLSGQGIPVQQTIDKYDGQYALQITTMAADSIWFFTGINNGYWDENIMGFLYGFPFTNKIDTLFGWYKYAPKSNGTGQVNIEFKKAGVSFGNTSAFLVANSGWTKFEIPIDLNQAPDSAVITINSSGWPYSLADTGSVLIIDAFQFADPPAPVIPLEAFSLGADRTNSYDFNLYGVISSDPDSAQYSFVYSTDPNFAISTSTTTKTVTSDSLAVVYGQATSLTPATTYYFYLTATSAQGTVISDTLQFYSDTLNPLLELAGTDVYGNFGIMNGRLKGLTGSHTVYFECGEKPDQLDSILLSDVGTITNANSYFARAFAGWFTSGKTYFYRMKAVGSTDSLFSDIRPFYIGKPFSVMQSLPATSIAATTANMNGQVQDFPVPLKLHTEYGSQYYNNHPASFYLETNNTLYNFVYSATQLQSERLYGYRFKAESWLGNFYGSDILFATGNQDSVFQTYPATNVSATSGTLNGFYQNIGFQMVAGFEYGTSSALGTYIQTDTISDALSHNPATTLSGLQPNNTYYYSLWIGFDYNNGAGIYGDTLQFTTDPVGIGNEPKVSGSIKIYPNPAGSQIQFLGESKDFYSLRIYDLLGKEILNCTTPATNRLDVSFLSPGVYFINTFNSTGEKTDIIRFIKK